MHYKTILVHVDTTLRTQERIRIAADMALANDAHLIGIAATGVSGLYYRPDAIAGNNLYLNSLLEVLEKRAREALAQFESTVQKMGVSTFETRMTSDEAGIGVSQQARYGDLVIIGQTDPDEPSPALRPDFPEHVVVHSGRPVLMIPYAGQFDHIGRHVLIAWDASKEAAKAVTAAIPLLRQAQAVQVAVFNAAEKPDAHGEEPGADIALYLARHDIKVEVTQQSTAQDVGSALLSHAANFNADLIVTGGYAHSRFREVLLGGVTRTVLEAMTVPVLMAH